MFHLFLFGQIEIHLTLLMNILIVINGLSDKLASIEASAATLANKYNEHSIDVRVTKSAGDSFRYAYVAATHKLDAILACGGDGTLNEVVNGVFNSNTKNIVLFAHYPCGNANDLARTIGFHDLNYYLEKIISGEHRTIDCAFIDRNGKERRFVNGSTAGIGALVCKDVSTLRRSLPSSLNYLVNTLAWVMRYKRPFVKIEMDDEVYEGEMMLAVIGKGHFMGNGLGFAPQASLTGGDFGVTVISRASVWQMISFRSKLNGKDKLDRHEVNYYKSKKVKITVLSGQMPIETDGEFLDILYEKETIVFELDKDSLCLVT